MRSDDDNEPCRIRVMCEWPRLLSTNPAVAFSARSIFLFLLFSIFLYSLEKHQPVIYIFFQLIQCRYCFVNLRNGTLSFYGRLSSSVSTHSCWYSLKLIKKKKRESTQKKLEEGVYSYIKKNAVLFPSFSMFPMIPGTFPPYLYRKSNYPCFSLVHFSFYLALKMGAD